MMMRMMMVGLLLLTGLALIADEMFLLLPCLAVGSAYLVRHNDRGQQTPQQEEGDTNCADVQGLICHMYLNNITNH